MAVAPESRQRVDNAAKWVTQKEAVKINDFRSFFFHFEFILLVNSIDSRYETFLLWETFLFSKNDENLVR